MLTGTRVLAVIAWLAVFVAAIGVALIDPWLMAVAGIVAALSATGWGLLATLRAGRMVREDERYRAEREAVWARRDAEHGTPYTLSDLIALRDELRDSRPISEGGKRAVWPHDAGSFE